jgi:hypothetical protein
MIDMIDRWMTLPIGHKAAAWLFSRNLQQASRYLDSSAVLQSTEFSVIILPLSGEVLRDA